jgi:hypothetical protein
MLLGSLWRSGAQNGCRCGLNTASPHRPFSHNGSILESECELLGYLGGIRAHPNSFTVEFDDRIYVTTSRLGGKSSHVYPSHGKISMGNSSISHYTLMGTTMGLNDKPAGTARRLCERTGGGSIDRSLTHASDSTSTNVVNPISSFLLPSHSRHAGDGHEKDQMQVVHE